MNKIFHILIIFLFFSNCSLDTKTGFWSQSQKLHSEKKENLENLDKIEDLENRKSAV